MTSQGEEAKVWLILPTFNEAENIRRVIHSSLAHLPQGSQVLVVDDDSPDGTGAIVDELSRTDSRVHVLHRKVREGLGPAYLAGFRLALAHGAESVCQMDSDLSHDPAALPLLLSGLGEADLVLGSRYIDGGSIENWSPTRRVISRAGSFYARQVLGVSVRDLTGGFKALSRGTVESLLDDEIAAQGYVFQIETTYRALRGGRHVVEIPITFREREHGKSKMSAAIALEAAWRVPLMRLKIVRGQRA